MSVEFQAGQLATPRAGTLVAVDSIGGEAFQRVKLDAGTSGVSLPVNAAAPLPVYPGAIASSTNNSTTPLASGATFTGTAEQNTQSDVMVSCITDNTGTLFFDFSVDGTNWNVFPTGGFTVASGIHEFHTAVKGPRYFRVRMVNNSGAQSYLRLYTYFGTFRHGNAPLNQSIGSDSDAIITRSVLVGATDGGQYINVPVTPEGHMEVAIHGPRMPFGEIAVESLEPVFQTDAVYGINPAEVITTTDGTSGIATATDNLFRVGTGGTTPGFFGAIQSRKRLRYRSGQGVMERFTMKFTTGIANNVQVVGIGTSESTYAFGYNGTSFGVLHSTGGVREIQTLTVTVGAGGAENVTVKLNNVDTVVAVTAGSTILTAYQLSRATYNGWKAEQRGATVVFVADSVGDRASTFSLASTGTTAGTFAETKAGVAATDTWVAQADWNGDVMNGTGSAANPSGVLLDPTKGNIGQISLQYLGFGAVSFYIEASPEGNNADFVNVHTFQFPNTRTEITTTQPSFPFLMSTYNTGTASGAVTVECGSFAGFITGKKKLTGPRMTYFLTAGVTTSTSAYTSLFTVRNSLAYAASGTARANQSVVNLLSVSGAAKGNANSVTSFFLVRNATLAGTPNFTLWDATSATYADTAATTCTFASNAQVIWSSTLTQDGNFIFAFEDEITIQPGETLTLCARSIAATATVLGQLNTREDQ